MLEDISYKNYKRKDDIHGTILYPAVMIAPVQKDILQSLVGTGKIRNIFDPFHGSGTALYEAFEVSNDIKLVGCDINPLANLIAKVKLQGVTESIYTDIENVKSELLTKKIRKSYTFSNSQKWFREDIARELTKIRETIINVKDDQNRRYFWYIMCDIIRRYSNTRSSTYKLHMKRQMQIDNLVNNVVEDYIEAIEDSVEKFRNGTNDFELFKCDTLSKIKEFKNNSFDLSITSPPYGDNATTVPYGQFSSLSLHWIDKKDIEFDGWELDTYSKIDTFSMGGLHATTEFEEFEYSLIRTYVEKIVDYKVKKVIRFFGDYFIFLREICRVTDKFIVMTLGNRTVDGITINLTEITMKYLENAGFLKIQVAQREILNKRTPKTTSKVNNQSVSSMNHEYVIIYEKEK